MAPPGGGGGGGGGGYMFYIGLLAHLSHFSSPVPLAHGELL